MKLSREQRTRLLKGNYRPLAFDHDPGVEKGDEYDLSFSPRCSVSDGLGGRVVVPRRRLRWIRVTRVVRNSKGGWTVRFDVFDNRDEDAFLRRKPPTYDAGLMQRDQLRPPTADDVERASRESSYTANPEGAVDHLPSVKRGWKDPNVKRRKERHQRNRKEAAQDELGDLHERVRKLQQQAARGADVGLQLKAIEQRVKAAENRLRKDAA